MEQQNEPGTLVAAAIYDSKVGVYFQPFFARSTAEAIRSFSDTVNQEGHIFNKHPGDFTLFVLAKWNEDSGRFDPTPTPISLGVGIEFITKDGPENQLDLVESARTA